MSNKRKYNLDEDDDENLQNVHVSNKKHTLDSDEEDSDDYEKDDIGDSDIEGGEEGVSEVKDKIKITPFNMKEELEEGHFDKDGHYHWAKSNDVKDNWLDNIDWVKIEEEPPKDTEKDELLSLNNKDMYNETQLYNELLSYMKEGETIGQTIRRFGKSRTKISTAERLKLKKQGIVDENAEVITKITEMANEILTKTGNMDVYQFTYEYLKNKVKTFPSTSKNSNLTSESFDMYSDDFNEKEKKQIFACKKEEKDADELLWEFKWKDDDSALQGPFNTVQMLKWSKDGYFKNGVYVRKVGEKTNFYTSNRIDFELYL